ncbi:39S ribosomal protein L2, mitochondrial-like [Dreissena polymorpha]|uniref:Ribosomal protein L2 n=1 Tax=Dreissena polymorpha TaxID=45954 RepID=A0A9D4MT33_DREPO|nr:39S ribosomal protein L2, mitochondrial-like [Dreissena polymorpha]KAH3881695.1 hypothetical protein DPMN_005622 [Dreissena polymorpha]
MFQSSLKRGVASCIFGKLAEYGGQFRLAFAACKSSSTTDKRLDEIPTHARRVKRPNIRFLAQGIDFNKYTHKPLLFPKTGGRNPVDGKIMNARIGGGHKQRYRMIDFTRIGIGENKPLEEKVIQRRYDPLRSAAIALVASGTHKRWILASAKVKVGDIVRSYNDIPTVPVNPVDGDSHPLGALPIGTIVHNVEEYPDIGGGIARAAGASATIKQKLADSVIIKMPSGREAKLDVRCKATVGKVDVPVTHTKPIGSPNRNRWFGIRPKSGLWHKKTGYNGRKIKPPKPMVVYEKKTQSVMHMFDG